MLTKTDVANLALGRLGATHQVTNIATEQSNTAKIIRRHFDMALSSVLTKHPWAVYTKQEALSLVRENPSPKWKYAYSLPDDAQVIRRLAIGALFLHEEEYLEDVLPFEPVYVAGGYEIHTNVPNAYAEYTCRIPDGESFVDHFGRALAAQLAVDIAPSIITNNYIKMKDVFLRESKNEINEQIANDITLSPRPQFSESPFIRARRRN